MNTDTRLLWWVILHFSAFLFYLAATEKWASKI